MPQPSITVHKFGGAALADLAAFRRAADIIAEYGGAQPVIVVSAMRGVTAKPLTTRALSRSVAVFSCANSRATGSERPPSDTL